jgi:hypothetical protein
MAQADGGLLVYAVKFLCGDFDRAGVSDAGTIEGPVKPGSYATAINVHNPQPRQVARLRKKAVLLFQGSAARPTEQHEMPRPPGNVLEIELGPDFGMEIDCADIRDVLLRTPIGPGPRAPIFIKGWVVLETLPTTPLDVVAVYTVRSFVNARPNDLAFELERVPGTLIEHP